MNTNARVMKNHRSDIYVTFKDGHKWVHAVKLGQPVRLDRLTHDQDAELKPALYKGQPYPVERACRRLLAYGKTVGITDGAKAALKQALASAKAAP